MQTDLPLSHMILSPSLVSEPVIGVGGFSVVSRLQAPDGMVALKIARDDGEAEACLRHEYALLRSLCVQPDGTACPFVPLVYGLLTDTSTPSPRLALAMAYIEGQSLTMISVLPTSCDAPMDHWF
jgi:Ser/Thr protein kinase RdoA (MazF antagonist)